MAVITSSTPKFYQCNSSTTNTPVSAVVGYEKPSAAYDRIVRYSFTAPAEGATSISVNFGSVSFGAGTSQTLHIKITTDANSIPLQGTANDGTISAIGSSTVGSATYTFSPNTQYYIWVYPSSHSKTVWWYWNTSACSITTYGSTAAIIPSISPTAVTLGNNLTITAKPPVNGYTCKLSCSIGNVCVYSSTSTYSSPSVSLSTGTDAFITAFINTSSGSSVELKVTCDTYTDSGAFVGTKTAVAIISLPDSNSSIYKNYFSPTVSLSATSVTENEIVKAWETDGVYVSGYSALELSANFSSNSGASISYYNLMCNGKQLGSGKQLAEKYTHTLSANNKTEYVTASLSITDTRGCKGEVSTDPYTVYAYNKPTFRISDKGRCESNYDGDVTDIYGIADPEEIYTPASNGKRAYVKLDAVTFSSINGKSSCIAKVSYMGNEIGSFNIQSGKSQYVFIAKPNDDTDAAFDLNEQHELIVTLTDALGNSASSTVIIPKRSVGLHLKKGGLGVAVGKYAEDDGIFDIGFSARFCDGVTPIKIEKLSDADSCTDTNIYTGSDKSCNGDFLLEVLSLNDDNSKVAQKILHYDSSGAYTQATRYLGGDNSWSAWQYPVDRIVEQGTTGIWTWRKWASGIAECWGTYSADGIDASKNNYMGFYYADGIRLDLPFTFSGRPTATVSGGGYSTMTIARTGSTTATQVGIWVVAMVSTATSVDVTVDIMVKGRWK